MIQKYKVVFEVDSDNVDNLAGLSSVVSYIVTTQLQNLIGVNEVKVSEIQILEADPETI